MLVLLVPLVVLGLVAERKGANGWLFIALGVVTAFAAAVIATYWPTEPSEYSMFEGGEVGPGGIIAMVGLLLSFVLVFVGFVVLLVQR